MLVLERLFDELRRANLTARPSKCDLCFTKVDFLGHVVGKGLHPQEEKIKCIAEAPVPKNKKQVRSFLGMIGYYAKFIPHFAVRAACLSDLTKKKMPNSVKWQECHQRAFDGLKFAITHPPVLRLPNFCLDFVVQTDASDVGIGGVLLQEEEGFRQPIAYASRKLRAAERNYSVIEKECLSVVWAVKKFHRYLYGRAFDLKVDHKPLQYLKRAKNLSARLMRWALSLQSYSFRVKAIPGKENVCADYLSRLYNE